MWKNPVLQVNPGGRVLAEIVKEMTSILCPKHRAARAPSQPGSKGSKAIAMIVAM